jgi:CheY-like chemotaxis protein
LVLCDYGFFFSIPLSNIKYINSINGVRLKKRGDRFTLNKIQKRIPNNILLVEDNPADIRIIKELFKDYKTENELYIVNDGIEALKFLYKQGIYEDMPRPDLILLDLCLPRKDGLEVLREIKKDKELKMLPVIVVTVSTDPNTAFKAYHHHANCVIIKPLGIDDFNRCITSMTDYWFNIVQLPISIPV